jgi:CheY-like chemotaxis protein/anti-sigma regulatory factor (Ser/Thr protein kinase)
MSDVLVVDDSSVDRELAVALLEEAGFSVEAADHGRAALERLARRAPRVVLTDLNMPEMDGLALVEAIRSRHPRVPVVLVTAHGSEQVAAAALRAGAASYVPKRNLHDDLVPTLARVLDAAVAQRRGAEARKWLVEVSHGFVLDSSLKWMMPLVSHIQEEMADRGLGDETSLIQVGVALNEALTNASHHGNLEIESKVREQGMDAYFALVEERRSQEPYRSRRVHVQARFRPDEAVVVVRDEGPGFDPSRVPDPRDPANLARPHGRGLMLIRTFMDDARHNATGNEITMVKRRPPPVSRP